MCVDTDKKLHHCYAPSSNARELWATVLKLAEIIAATARAREREVVSSDSGGFAELPEVPVRE